MDTKLKNFLKKNKIKYDLEEHKKVYTAFDEAETQDKKPKEVAKTVLVRTEIKDEDSGKTEKSFALVVIPAAKNVDLKKVKKKLKAKKVKMATENDITKKLKTKIGLLHPFGPVFDLPTLVDNAVLKQKKIITSAGSYTESLVITSARFKKAVDPITGSFSKAK